VPKNILPERSERIEPAYLEPTNYYHWGQWKQPVLSWSFWEWWFLAKGAVKLPKDLQYEYTPILIIDGHFYIYRSRLHDNMSKQIFEELSLRQRPLIDYYSKRQAASILSPRDCSRPVTRPLLAT
jgi:hypothetical protein